jgi:hypothetical protein
MARKKRSPAEEAGRSVGEKKVDDRFKDSMEGFIQKQRRDIDKWMKEQTGR